MKFLDRIHWPGTLAFLTTAFGVVSSPAMLAILPVKAAVAVTGIGSIAQAITKAIHSKGQE